MSTIFPKVILLFILFSFVLNAQEKVNQIDLPNGYQRLTFPVGTYNDYIQNLPLKKDKTIYEWDGSQIWISLFSYEVLAVVDKPILYKEDLEQCADYSMRFWADYHKDTGKLKNLFLYNYEGNKKFFKNSGKSYLKYLRWHMAFSNSYSLKSGAENIDGLKKLIPGDMFVQNKDGGIGHVSVVVDVAENDKNERIYLIGYSYMPAQEFHIEDAVNQNGTGAWFSKEGYEKYLSKSRLSKYGKAVIRRF